MAMAHAGNKSRTIFPPDKMAVRPRDPGFAIGLLAFDGPDPGLGSVKPSIAPETGADKLAGSLSVVSWHPA